MIASYEDTEGRKFFSQIATVKPYPDVDNQLSEQMVWGLLLANNSMKDVNQILKVDALENAAKRYHQMIGAQIAHSALFSPETSDAIGDIIINQNCLFVRPVALRGMEVTVAVMIALILVTLFATSNYDVCSRNPGSMGAVAAILRKSHHFRMKLSGTGSSSLASLQQILTNATYTTIENRSGPSQNFQIHLNEDTLHEEKQAEELHNADQSYEPFPGLIWRGVIVVLIILVAIVLEILLSVSQRKHGFGDVTDNSGMHYLWTFLPAIVMISIGLFYGSLDLTARYLSPYAELRKSNGSSFKRSLAANHLNSIPPATILNAFKLKQWAIFNTTIATIMGSFLAIIAAGLFSTVPYPESSNMKLQSQTWFASDLRHDYKTEYFGVSIAGMIILGNLSYQKWTYEDLAFPKLNISADTSKPLDSISQAGFIQSTFPALRTKLTCGIIDDLVGTLHNRSDVPVTFMTLKQNRRPMYH